MRGTIVICYQWLHMDELVVQIFILAACCKVVLSGSKQRNITGFTVVAISVGQVR